MVSHGVSSAYGVEEPREDYVTGSVNTSSIAREVPKFMQIPDNEQYEGFYAHNALNEKLRELALGVYNADRLVSFGPWKPNKVSHGEGWVPPVDLAEAFQVKGKSLLQMAAEVYDEMESEFGPLLRYFLRTSIVYVETPYNKYDPSTKTRQTSIKKELYTANLEIAQKWDQSESVKGKMLTKFEDIDSRILSETQPGFSDEEEAAIRWIIDDDSFSRDSSGKGIQELLPVAKPVKTRGAKRKIVNPQKPLNIATPGLRFIPLFILDVLAEYINTASAEGALGIDFLRENGAERKIVTTAKYENIASVYGEEVSNEVKEFGFHGDFYEGMGAEPGGAYLKLPSIGESKFSSIMRSITLPRITKLEKGRQPDLMFINVRIDLVDAEFMHAVNSIFDKNPGRLFSVMDAARKEGLTRILINPDPYEVEQWLLKSKAVDGTIFLRNLVVFMLAHAEWFPNFSTLSNGTGSLTGVSEGVDKEQSSGLL